MTYNMFGGTLNLTQFNSVMLSAAVLRRRTSLILRLMLQCYELMISSRQTSAARVTRTVCWSLSTSDFRHTRSTRRCRRTGEKSSSCQYTHHLHILNIDFMLKGKHSHQ